MAPNDVDQEERPDEFAGQVRSGLRWSFVNTLGVRVMSFGSGIVLARLLVPEDFGVFAAALAIVNILFGWNDLGMLLALVRWQGDLKRAARTAMTLSLVPSILIYVACFLLAPAFANLMDSPRSIGILRVIALTVVIDGLVAVPQGLLVRTFAQKRMALVEFTAVPVNVITTVVLALLGFGPWALALGQVVGNCVSATLLIIMAPFRVRPGFDRVIARSMLSFGIPLAFTSFVEYVLLNADYVVVGSFLGPVALGFYLLAFNVSNWPVNLLSDAIRRVSIAGFARLSKDEAGLRSNFNPTFALLLRGDVAGDHPHRHAGSRGHPVPLRRQMDAVGGSASVPRRPRRREDRRGIRLRSADRCRPLTDDTLVAVGVAGDPRAGAGDRRPR